MRELRTCITPAVSRIGKLLIFADLVGKDFCQGVRVLFSFFFALFGLQFNFFLFFFFSLTERQVKPNAFGTLTQLSYDTLFIHLGDGYCLR